MDDHEQFDVAAVIAAALDGSQDAWDRLVDRYASLVAAVVVAHRLFGADGQDVAQIVWLRMVERLGELREPRALPKWLMVTTRNECCRALRARQRIRPFDPLDEEFPGPLDLATPEELVLEDERWQTVVAALAELSDRQRTVLRMFAENPDISYAEVSGRLGMPVGSIGPTRIRAAQKLRASPAVSALFGARPDAAEPGGAQQ